MTLATRTVTATYQRADGTACAGSVTFTPNTSLAAALDDVMLPAKPVRAVLSATGQISVVLVCTDAAGVSPTGWAYEVAESLNGEYRTYTIQIPTSGGALNLADAVPLEPAPALVQYVLAASVGQVGGPAGPLNGSGDVPIAQIPDLSGSYLPLAGGTVGGALTVSGRLTAGAWPLPLIAPSNPAPRWRDVSSIVSLFQSGHGWTTSGTPGSSNLNDTATFARGTQSARITSNGSGTTCGIQKLAMSSINLTGKALRLLFRLDDPSRLGNLVFFVGTSSLANNFKWRYDAETATNKIAKAGEWVVVTLGWAEINTASGTFSLSSTGAPSVTTGFTDMRFEVSDAAGGAITANLQAIEIIDAPVSTYPTGVCSIVFDDSNSSPETLGRPKMDTLGFRGTQYTIVDVLGASGRLTLTQLKSLQNNSGWEIAGHAYTGAAHDARYPTLTAAQVDDELRNLRAWLVSNGFVGDSFAYPGGQFENTTDGVPVEDLVARYFSAGRTILSLTGVSTHASVDMVPPAMRYRLRGMSSVSSTQSGPNNPANLVATGGVLDKVASNSGWLVLVFHKITSGTAADSTECSQADFNSIMDGIAARSIKVQPVGDVVRAGVT